MTKQEILDLISSTLAEGECGTITPTALSTLLNSITNFIEQEVNNVPAGPAGATPTIGGNGNWWINGADTGVVARGTDGADGNIPQIGTDDTWVIGGVDTTIKARATDGITPHIDTTTGNWFIGDSDTGVSASGSSGATGATGAPGQDGITPVIGPNGNWWSGSDDTGVPASVERQVDYDADISGDRTIESPTFVASKTFVPGTMNVYVNGLRLTKGNNLDFIEVDTQRVRIMKLVSMADKVIFDYQVKLV